MLFCVFLEDILEATRKDNLQMIRFCKNLYPAMYSCFVHSGLVSIATSPTVLVPSLVVAPCVWRSAQVFPTYPACTIWACLCTGLTIPDCTFKNGPVCPVRLEDLTFGSGTAAVVALRLAVFSHWQWGRQKRLSCSLLMFPQEYILQNSFWQ